MAEETKVSKPKTEVTQVAMTDGRTVGFAGKRKLVKETLIDEGKIVLDGETVCLQAGAVSIRMDFVNGETRLFALPISLLAKYAGHGAEQKFGDELAAPADKQLSPEDMVVAVDDLYARHQAGNWSATREAGDGFSGASVVIRALMEATGKAQEVVKAFLQKKLDAAVARGEKLSRKELYDSFRAPGTKTAVIIDRLEKEKLAKNVRVDADAELAELEAA